MSIKRHLNIAGLAVATMIFTSSATAALAQDRDSVPETHYTCTLAKRLPLFQKTTALMGLTIYDRGDRKLGRIDDFVIDLQDNEVVCAVVSLADIYGGKLHILIPSGSFYAADDRNTVLKVEKSNLYDAPRIVGLVPDAPALVKPLADACAYFKVSWNGVSANLLKSSQLVGMPEYNPAGRPLGKVMDLIVDLPSSHIFYVVGSFDGSQNRLYAVPPAAQGVNLEKHRAILKAERTDIDQVSEWTSFFWSDIVSPAWAAGTYHRYGEKLVLTNSCVVVTAPGREYVRTRIDESPATSSGGTAMTPDASDNDITKSIMAAFVRDDVVNAWAHKDIKVTTTNGRVVLNGTVKNEKQKDRFGELAEGIAGTGNVDNQLETRK